jgi:hypothetical protein
MTCSFNWLSVARNVFPYDWIFREEFALALRRVREGAAPDALADALGNVAFEE